MIGQLALGLLAMMICLPSMQQWTVEFGASQAAVQLTFAGYVATYGLLQLVYGAVSDRIGRRPALMVGLVLAALGSFGAALAASLPWLIVARIVQGGGCAAGMVIGRALVQDRFTGADRTRVMALIGMSMGVCPPLALVLGGQLHVQLGWQSNFVLIGLFAMAIAAAAWRTVPPGRPPREPARHAASAPARWHAGYAQLAAEPRFVLFVALLAMLTSTFYAFLGGAPVVLARYGITPERIGLYMMVGPASYAVGNLLTARLQRTGLPDRQLMLVGQAVTLAGVLTLLALAVAGVHTPMALAAPMTMVGFGHGLLMPPTLAGTVGLVPALAGSASAVAGLTQQLLGALGGFVAGLVALDTPTALTLLMLGCALTGALAQALLMRHQQRAGPR